MYLLFNSMNQLIGLIVSILLLLMPQLAKAVDLNLLPYQTSEAVNKPLVHFQPVMTTCAEKITASKSPVYFQEAKKVVLLHGLYMKGFTMGYLAYQLHNKGYQVLSPNYDTTRKSLTENEVRLAKLIQKFKGDQPVYYVAHSMGGLMLHYLQADYPELFKGSRVVTLGTPHNGAAFARYQYNKENGPPFNSLMWVFSRFFSVRKSWKDGLDGHVPVWNPNIPLLTIVGTKTGFINRLFKVFPRSEPNDSLVSVKESKIPQEQGFQQLHITHLGLLFSRRVVQRVLYWFTIPARRCTLQSK